MYSTIETQIKYLKQTQTLNNLNPKKMEQIYTTITKQEITIRRFGLALTAVSSVYLALYIMLGN